MNLLTDVIPPQYRKMVYAIVTLAAFLFGAWQAAEGNTEVFIASVLAGLTTGMAGSNVTIEPSDVHYDGHQPGPDAA